LTGAGGQRTPEGRPVIGWLGRTADVLTAGPASNGQDAVSGNLLYQVPTDQATGGLLIVEPTFSFDDALAFLALQ
jgi:hypothetical protein